MVPPCREACLDFLEGCVAHLISFLPKIKLITGKNFTNISEIDRQQMMNCNYLPMVNGTSPCFYEPVSCPAPPSMQNGYLLNVTNSTGSYPVGSAQNYVCLDEDDITENKTVTWLYSGQ